MSGADLSGARRGPLRYTVGDAVVDGLARAGITRVFAAGGVLAGALAEAARRYEIDVIAVGSAPAACVMAAVTARLTDRPATAVLPGTALAEAAAALAHAALDRAPVVVITDAAGAPAPAVKGTLALEPASAAHWMAHALQRASIEPPGLMHVAVTVDVLGTAAVPVATVVRPRAVQPEAAALEAVAQRLVAASRPVVLAGIGCRRAGASAWLRPFAEALPAPVIVTRHARGVLADPHPLNLGVLGSAGAASVLGRADLLVALGVDAIELLENAWPGATVLDVAPAGGGDAARPAAAIEVHGDVALVLEELAPRLRDRARADWDVAELDRIKRGAAPAVTDADATIVALAREALPSGAVAAADEPYAAALEAAWQAVAPHELLTPLVGGLRGFAVAAAVGARLARPSAPAIALAQTGPVTDAALETAVRLALPVITVLLGRGALPRGVPIAAARTPQELRGALTLALAARGPVALDARR